MHLGNVILAYLLKFGLYSFFFVFVAFAMIWYLQSTLRPINNATEGSIRKALMGASKKVAWKWFEFPFNLNLYIIMDASYLVSNNSFSSNRRRYVSKKHHGCFVKNCHRAFTYATFPGCSFCGIINGSYCIFQTKNI